MFTDSTEHDSSVGTRKDAVKTDAVASAFSDTLSPLGRHSFSNGHRRNSPRLRDDHVTVGALARFQDTVQNVLANLKILAIQNRCTSFQISDLCGFSASSFPFDQADRRLVDHLQDLLSVRKHWQLVSFSKHIPGNRIFRRFPILSQVAAYLLQRSLEPNRLR